MIKRRFSYHYPSPRAMGFEDPMIHEADFAASLNEARRIVRARFAGSPLPPPDYVSIYWQPIGRRRGLREYIVQF